MWRFRVQRQLARFMRLASKKVLNESTLGQDSTHLRPPVVRAVSAKLVDRLLIVLMQQSPPQSLASSPASVVKHGTERLSQHAAAKRKPVQPLKIRNFLFAEWKQGT